ncbi:MAG: hypothetical protein AAF563_11710 [Pseudomonadota bacterium]
MADKKSSKSDKHTTQNNELGGILSHEQLEKLAAAVSNAQANGAAGATPAGYYFADE